MAETRSPLTQPAGPALDDAYRIARRRVRRLRGWQVHALVYACVISGLWLVFVSQLYIGRSIWPWPLPATMGWGLGLAIHGLVVWLGSSPSVRQWEARKIEAYMREEQAAREAHREAALR